MKTLFSIFILSLSVGIASSAFADSNKKVSYKKTQEVNFENTDIDGKVNSPDGAFLAPKRGVKFLPIYKVNDQFEKNILSSVDYL